MLKAAEIEKGEVSEVILMGGSSRIPYLKNLLADFFEISTEKLKNSISEDEGVAMGATYMAAILTGQLAEKEKAKVIVNDVVPLRIGIQTIINKFVKLVESNSTIPC